MKNGLSYKKNDVQNLYLIKCLLVQVMALPSELGILIMKQAITAYPNASIPSFRLVLNTFRHLSPVPIFMMSFHCTMLSIRRRAPDNELFHYYYVSYSEMLSEMGIERYSRRHIDLVTKRSVNM